MPESQQAWRCLNCNYTHAGDAPPDMCPVCGAEAERFEPLAEALPEQGSTPEAIRAVVVGGGIAGVSAAEAIRRASPESSIVLLSSEPCIPYYRLNLTRYLAGEIDSASMPIQPASWYDENRIDLQLGRKIVALMVWRAAMASCAFAALRKA